MLNIDLTGRTALITGGSRGIGAAAGRVLASAGAAVALTDIVESTAAAESVRAAGGRAISLVADVTRLPDLQAAAERAASELGPPDILVASAGILSKFSVQDLASEEWERILRVNLTGSFHAIKAVLPAMLERGRGSIVLIGSAAIVAGSGGGVHYAASKAALEGLTHGTARELAGKGIRCNLIHPSLIETELLTTRHPDPAKRQELARQVPLGRLGTAEDIAHLCAFLSSELASYITGQSFFVDGGRTFLK